MDGASALVINTDDNDDSPNDDDSKRSNTSKNKLESLLGKEFKHPRRKCGICGYMVSYSNYKGMTLSSINTQCGGSLISYPSVKIFSLRSCSSFSLFSMF